MKKTIVRLYLAGLIALGLGACAGTPQQQAATGVYAVGEAVSAQLITKGVAPATITDIAKKLALVPGGTLTPSDYGTLSGEIQQVRDALSTVQAGPAVPGATSANYAAIDGVLKSCV